MESEFMKVFREDMLTLRILHSYMIKRFPHDEQNYLPSSFFEVLLDDKADELHFAYENEIPNLYAIDSIYPEKPKNFNYGFKVRHFDQLEEELRSFERGTS